MGGVHHENMYSYDLFHQFAIFFLNVQVSIDFALPLILFSLEMENEFFKMAQKWSCLLFIQVTLTFDYLLN